MKWNWFTFRGCPEPPFNYEHDKRNLHVKLKKHRVIVTDLSLQCSCCVVCKHLFISESHLKWSKADSPSPRPVALALDLPSLLQVGDHDNGRRSLLPHQPPKVHQCLGQGTYIHTYVQRCVTPMVGVIEALNTKSTV